MEDDERLLALAVRLLRATGVSAAAVRAVEADAAARFGRVAAPPPPLDDAAVLRARLLALCDGDGGGALPQARAADMGSPPAASHSAAAASAARAAAASPSRKRRKTREPVRRSGDPAAASSTGGHAPSLLDPPLASAGAHSPAHYPMTDLLLWNENSLDGLSLNIADHIASFINQRRDHGQDAALAANGVPMVHDALLSLESQPGTDLVAQPAAAQPAAAQPGVDDERAAPASTGGSTSFDMFHPLPLVHTDGMLEALEQEPVARRGLESLAEIVARNRSTHAFTSPAAAVSAPGHPLSTLDASLAVIDDAGPAPLAGPTPLAGPATPAAPLAGDLADAHLAPSPAGVQAATSEQPLPGVDINQFLASLKYGKGKGKAKPRTKSKRR